MAERRRSAWPYWRAAALLVLPIFYVLSIGPIYGLGSRDLLPDPLFAVAKVYAWPFERAGRLVPEWLNHLMWAYLNLWD